MTNWKRFLPWPVAALVLIGSALVGRAQELPRTIDFTRPLIGLDGKALTNPNPDSKGEPIPVTLSDVCVSALFSTLDEDKAVPATEKGALAMRLYDLAHKIYKAKAVVLDASEIALIEKRIPQIGYGIVVVAPALRMLDPGLAKGK
jgi:hypothetical protein